MKDFNDLLTTDKATIRYSLGMLSGDDKLNYLYFLRDHINKLIKSNKVGVK